MCNIKLSLSLSLSLGLRSDGEFPSVWVAVSGVVGALLVLRGEHLPAASAGELSRLVDVLEMSLHGWSGPEPFPAVSAGNSFVLTAGIPHPGTRELLGRLHLALYRRLGDC